MLKKSVLSVSALALVSAALLWAQGQVRQQQGFTDCDLDIRPENPNRPEVQVYWTNAPNAATGMQFQLWTSRSDVIKIGLPDGSNEIYLKRGVENTVTFLYDAVAGTASIQLCNLTPNPTVTPPIACPTAGPFQIPVIGDYNSELELDTPKEQEARAPVNNSERLLITGYNDGLEYSFTLTRY